MKRVHYAGGLTWRHGPKMRGQTAVVPGWPACNRGWPTQGSVELTSVESDVTCRICLRCLRLAAITVAWKAREAAEEAARCAEFEEAVGA